MIARRSALCSVAAAALLAATIPTVHADTAAATKVAVVNLGKVFTSLQQTKDVKAKVEADQRNLKGMVDQHQQDLLTMRQQRDSTLKPDSPQYDDMTQQLEQKTIQYETELKIKQVDLQRGQARQLKGIYDLIQSTVSDVAKQRGYELVITESNPDFPPNAGDLTPDQMSQLINQRNMLYVSPSVDLSNEVVTALDAKYRASGH